MKTTCIALLFLLVFANSALAYDVIFNTKTYIFHTPACEWARKCTKSCVKIDHILAQRRGGVPCKVCGGLEMSTNFKNGDAKNNELAEIERLKDEMANLMAWDLERMKTISPTFDSDYETLHGKNERPPD
jgi:hypothetical protein